MSSNRPASIGLSLTRLAAHGGFDGPHRDGWGVAYFEHGDVRLIKEAEAAADSEWVRFLEDHDLRSELVLAHIRHATVGDRAHRNTQPFARELGGRMHLFAHNGELHGLADATAMRFRPVGETDSEQAFCVLLERLAPLYAGRDGLPPLAARFDLVAEFAADLRGLGVANFLYADGDALFAHGHHRRNEADGRVCLPGLVLQLRHCEGTFDAPGLSIEPSGQALALVVSVPLSDEPWRPLAEGEVVAIRSGQLAATTHPA